MRDPFDPQRKWTGWSRRLMEFDSWVDASVYSLTQSGGGVWENITIFFRRFRVYGFKKFLVELSCEGLTLGLAGAILMLTLALPAFEETEKDWRSQSDYSVIFLDRFGNEIGRRGILHNDAEPIDSLPDHVIKAVLATEDRRFFEHYGIDFIGLVRAMVENARARAVVQGGSTITQQLAKNLFLTNERTLQRKIKEAYLSLWLEYNLTKKEILKLYLDRAYMGGGTFGIAAAAEFYFGKNIKNVNLAEAAMLAGLYKAPAKYAPHINLPAARARANEVLTNMVQAEFMTEGQVISARRNPATALDREGKESPDYFLDWAFDEVKKLAVDFPTHTMVARTTIDMSLQRAAEEAVVSHLRQYGEPYGVAQASMVVIENGGAVRAVVGGRDYGESQFNRATQSSRQAGSSFKPFVYAAAVGKLGLNAKSRLVDGPVSYKGWSPRNYSGGYRGRTDLTTALVKSINTIPVKLGIKMGRKPIAETAKAMGITSPLQMNASMPLGTNDVTALEMASGYGVFMTGGYSTNTHGVVQITDAAGTELYNAFKDRPQPKRILSDKVVETLNIALSQVPEWGTARRAKIPGVKTAGKTGTTQSYRDAWFVGYTGNYVGAVWFGNDNYQPTRRLTGGRLPAMTWNKFMTYAHQDIDIRPIPFIEPEQKVAEKKNEPVAADPGSAEAPITKAKQRPLPNATNKVLKSLEQVLRSAKRLRAPVVSADAKDDTDVKTAKAPSSQPQSGSSTVSQ
ncbi:MAG: PBP1A family penicillin-binding protein [Pseudomonadota bacterium]